MKQKRKLPVLAVSLAVLAAAWLLAESTAGRLSVRQEEAESAEIESVVLSAGTEADIRSLTWSRNGEEVSLRREDAGWVRAGDRKCPIDQTAAAKLSAAAADVQGLMSITGVTDFVQYGLDVPALTLTVETMDHQVTYEVGNKTLTGEYYLRVDGTDTVYTVGAELPEAYPQGLEGLIAFESGPEDIASVVSLSVTGGMESYEILRQDEAGELWYGSAYEWYAVRGGETGPLAAESASSLCEAVADAAFVECVDWNETHFERYGLDMPQVEAELIYMGEDGTQKSFALRFGDYKEEQVYVSIAGSEMVYLTAGTVLDKLMYPDWEAMTPLTVCPVDMGSVTGLTVAVGGHLYEVERFTETTTEVDTDGDMETLEKDYYVANGWTLDSDGTESWLAELTSLTAESLAGEAQGREELFSVTFLLDSERWPEISLSVWSYDSARCLCVVNEGEGYFISRVQAEALVTAAEKLLILE